MKAVGSAVKSVQWYSATRTTANPYDVAAGIKLKYSDVQWKKWEEDEC